MIIYQVAYTRIKTFLIFQRTSPLYKGFTFDPSYLGLVYLYECLFPLLSCSQACQARVLRQHTFNLPLTYWLLLCSATLLRHEPRLRVLRFERFGERRQGYHLWKVGSQASRLFEHHLLWRHRRTAPQASRNTRATQNGKHNWHTGWLAHVTTNMCCPFCSTPDSSLQSRKLGNPVSERRSLPEAPVKESKIASQRASWFFCARNRISQKVLRGR